MDDRIDAADLPALRTLTAVGATGSITAASEAEGISQQAASARVHRLESRLGLALVNRSGRATGLTAHGALVAEWAVDLLEAETRFASAVRSLRADTRTTVRVAASLTVAEHLLPGRLVALAERTGASASVLAENSRQVVEHVRAGTVDLGVVETPEVPDDLRQAVVAHDELVVVVRPAHPWAVAGTVDPGVLAATPLIAREEGSGTRRALEVLLADDGTLAPPAQVLTSTSAIRAAAAAGLAPAVLSILAVRDDLLLGRLTAVPVRGTRLVRPLTAVWRRDPLPAAAAALLEVMRDR